MTAGIGEVLNAEWGDAQTWLFGDPRGYIHNISPDVAAQGGAGEIVRDLPSNGAKGADTFYRNADQFWTEYNRPFLDAAISRGDAIVLTTKPTRDVLVNVDTGELTGFGRELEYLNQKGYHFDPATNRMVRTGK